MAKKIIKGKIGNAITSVAEDHIVVVSEDVFDEKHQKYQSEINDISMSGSYWNSTTKQVLFDRLKSNLAQCINDGTIYFVKDSNGNFTQLALGDGSKSHVVGIGPKMDDATKKELMSKLGLTISSDMGTIQLGKLANHNGVSSQKVITYERTGLGTDIHEISTVGYVQQYMKTTQAMVYAGIFNAQTKEITDYNTAIISPSEEGNVTLDYLLDGYEGETLLTPGMSFIVGTAGNLEGYTGISVYGGQTNVEVGDMIIIINVQQKEGDEGGSTYNEASILIIQNTNLNITEFKSGIIYDVSAHNDGAVFESLSALLSSSSLDTLIPTSVRRGGMSIKFIHSSDNKYVQYRLMNNQWSTTVTDWQGVDDEPTANSENLVKSGGILNLRPSIAVLGDILSNFRGETYYPISQSIFPNSSVTVVEDMYWKKLQTALAANCINLSGGNFGVTTTISGQSLYKRLNQDVARGLNLYILQAGFVDSANNVTIGEEDYDTPTSKLSESTFATAYIKAIRYIKENNENADILCVISTDIKQEYIDSIIRIANHFNIPYCRLVDSGNNDKDNHYFYYHQLYKVLSEKASNYLIKAASCFEHYEYIDAKKYLYIVKDSGDKLLLAIDFEGNVVFGNGCPKQIKELIKPLLSFLSETEEDIKERLELTLDQNGNLLSWRDKDGTKHEAVFTAGKFVFSDANKRQLVNALKEAGYGNLTDWSDASNIAIPIPRCAKINVTNVSSMPNTKTTNARAIVQFWDMQGNTFTKTATLNAQGQHSMGDPKKNISIDLHDHNWDGDFSIKFGDWVPQSSFHMKSYWLDWSRVVGPVSYDVIEQVDKSRGILKDRTWKRALMTSSVTENSDLDLRMDTGAKCHPMGFPCIIYLNSEFYGIFIWQLKKHRDNYHMKKDNHNHIHVEGLNLSRGDFSWTGSEIRNPKYLVYAEPHSGTYEYDGDIAVAEIAGEKDGTVASAYSDSTTYTKGSLCIFNDRMFMSLADNNIGNIPVSCTKPKNVFKNATDYWIDITFTNTVKQTILRAKSYYSEISAADTTEAKKVLIEQYYDMDNVIDIALEIAAMRDSDYVGNIQSTTWDGVKWYLNAYDKDRSLGLGFTQHTDPPSTGSLPISGAFDYIIPYYKTEAKERWNELVEKGIFTLENISGILNDWMQRIGYENYNLEDAKWPPSGDYTYDTVERLYNYIEQNLRVQNEYMNNL